MSEYWVVKEEEEEENLQIGSCDYGKVKFNIMKNLNLERKNSSKKWNTSKFRLKESGKDVTTD